jgi:hypothetical protein
VGWPDVPNVVMGAHVHYQQHYHHHHHHHNITTTIITTTITHHHHPIPHTPTQAAAEEEEEEEEEESALYQLCSNPRLFHDLFLATGIIGRAADVVHLGRYEPPPVCECGERSTLRG